MKAGPAKRTSGTIARIAGSATGSVLSASQSAETSMASRRSIKTGIVPAFFPSAAVGQGDGHRAVPDRAGHALDRAGAHVAGRERGTLVSSASVALQRPPSQRAVDPQRR